MLLLDPSGGVGVVLALNTRRRRGSITGPVRSMGCLASTGVGLALVVQPGLCCSHRWARVMSGLETAVGVGLLPPILVVPVFGAGVDWRYAAEVHDGASHPGLLSILRLGWYCNSIQLPYYEQTKPATRKKPGS